MSCEECSRARATNGAWNRYDSRKCVFCAARLIQAIGRMQGDKQALSARRTASLKDSVEWGLDEARIRALVKSGLALAPVEKDRKK